MSRGKTVGLVFVLRKPVMKRVVLVFLLFSLVLPLRAEGDVIEWQGQSLGILFEQPVARLDTSVRNQIMNALRFQEGNHVYVFEGSLHELNPFRTCWSIADNKLCLDSLGIFERIDGQDVRLFRNADWLKELFQDYWQDGRIIASWFSGTFKAIPSGVRPIELSLDFYTTWEKEWIFEFRDGELVSARWDDHLVHEGTTDIYSWTKEESPFVEAWRAFPYECFPALEGCKFRVLITQGVLDETGRMIDFTPVIRRRPAILDEDHELETALIDEIKKRLLVADWTIYRIGDEYAPGWLDWAVHPFELTFPSDLQQVSRE